MSTASPNETQGTNGCTPVGTAAVGGGVTGAMLATPSQARKRPAARSLDS